MAVGRQEYSLNATGRYRNNLSYRRGCEAKLNRPLQIARCDNKRGCDNVGDAMMTKVLHSLGGAMAHRAKSK